MTRRAEVPKLPVELIQKFDLSRWNTKLTLRADLKVLTRREDLFKLNRHADL